MKNLISHYPHMYLQNVCLLYTYRHTIYARASKNIYCKISIYVLLLSVYKK